MSLQKHFDQIEELGFSVVPEVVGREEVETLKVQLKAALEQDMAEYGSRPGKEEYLVVDLVIRGSAFVKLLENDKMHQVFSHFLTDTCILYSYTSTILRPDEKGNACCIHVDLPRFIPNYHSGICMTLALDDFTEQNGATYYLPYSHKSPEAPSEEFFYEHAVRVVRKAGDAVFFNPRVFHAGGINRTDKVRYGLTIFACRSFMKQRFDFPRMVTPAILALVGSKGKAFLGFNVRVPTSQDEFYVPAGERLYRANQG